jgi:hypothetical protein
MRGAPSLRDRSRPPARPAAGRIGWPGRRRGSAPGRLRRAVEDVTELLGAPADLAETRQRLAGFAGQGDSPGQSARPGVQPIPRAHSANRGFGQAGVDAVLRGLGVRNPVIPTRETRQGQQAKEHRPRVPRVGQVEEDRLRRADQSPQTRLRLGPYPPGWHRRGRTWLDSACFAYNVVKIGALMG